MAIKPKDLNQNNSGYGFKQMRHAWEANLSLVSRLQENYNLGAYDRVLRDGIETLKGHGIKSTANLSQMHEAHLATFYFLGKSYLGLGQTENAIACFHIVYSQHGFEKKMLSRPLDFPGLVARAGAELQDIAQERGESYVNGIQVDEFMAREFKGGCFVATAVYDSPSAPEVLTLRKFRDQVLMRSKLGSLFVKTYYFTSPPIATLVRRAEFLRRILRRVVFEPLLGFLNQQWDR